MKRMVLTILLVMLVVFPATPPRHARAQIPILGVPTPVIETNPILITAATNTSLQATANTTHNIAQTAFQIATEALKRRLLNLVTDQIIGWIEGEGKPLFITDWKQFLRDAASIAVGDIAYELGLGALCSPFSFQVQISVLRPPRFTDRIICTLDDIVANIENFYNDFRNGGFIAYSEMWQPQNNYYGMVMMAMYELERRVSEESEASILEALAGGGFLGTRRCDSSGRFCTITTPGAQIGALAAKALGSDIDYLINATDLAVYVGAIADALINRLIRAGAQGLISLTTPAAPASGSIGERSECAGLTGETLTNCLSILRAREGDFVTVQKNYLERIDPALEQYEAAQVYIDRSIASQTPLVDALFDLRDCQFGLGLAAAEATQEELERESFALNQLEIDSEDNNSAIASLRDARDKIANPPIHDTPTISFYFNGIAYLLDAKAAEEFKDAKAHQQEQITAKANQRLPAVQQELTSCRGF